MTPKHVTDFPPDTRWVQFPGSAVAVVSPDLAYRVDASGIHALVFREPPKRKPRKGLNLPAIDTGD